MDTRHFETTVEISVTPVYHSEPPLITVQGFDLTWHDYLDQPRIFVFDKVCSPGQFVFSVELLNKKDSDTIPDQGLDKAVTIDWIAINGIKDQKFLWKSEYRPIYPEPWFSQQSPRPAPCLYSQNYIGWNGVWSLAVDVPAFLWIHDAQGLGWVFE